MRDSPALAALACGVVAPVSEVHNRMAQPRRVRVRPLQTFTVVDALFKTEPLYVVGCSHAVMASYLHRRFGVEVGPCEDAEAYAGQMLTFQVAPYRVIWVRQRSRAGLPVALHETFHLVTRICADKGIPIVAHHAGGENGDEPAAYLFEFFARAVLKHWGVRWPAAEE